MADETTPKTIRELFSSDIERRIEEVIKVDQDDAEVLRDELAEYVVTDSIRSHFTEILERYRDQKPHEGIGVWVSGFFGSGKSSFAKYLGLALEDREILGEGAGRILGRRTGTDKAKVLLDTINEKITTDAVIFDVSTDRGIRTGSQTITEIMYRLFLQNLGYARDLDLSELEITLEAEGRLDAFKEQYRELYDKDWDREKGKIALAVQQASRVMHALEPDTYTTVDSWRESAMRRADITPGDLARRCLELTRRRSTKKNLVFVVDEVGQFVARDVQKMLDLQAVVQNLGRQGRGRLWLVVTSQEKLSELVGGLDDRRVELARLMDRFPLQVHLEPSDISEVTSKRVLAKNADAEKALRELFTEHRGRLSDHTRLTADVRLPALDASSFIDLYPLLPYQIGLIIDVVSGLRTAGGASKHVGGANRTIIKLAQQLLIHPGVDLASRPVGALARIDQVYDLVSGNIASEIRGKIADVAEQVDHPLAQPVAKAICLLQYVRSVHRTPQNLAAALHPAVDADSRLPEVRAALEALEKAHMVRHGDDGYRIPSPAEDDWERQREGLRPKPGDSHRLHAEIVTGIWQPQPSHTFLDVKVFKAGLVLAGRPLVAGEVPVHLTLVDDPEEVDERVAEARKRSQAETLGIFWVAALDDAVERETVELFRSREILSRRERGAQTKDENALVAEEKLRQRRHQEELRRLMKGALLNGSVFFRGNDRGPGDGADDVVRTAARLLATALPEVFDRFQDAAARIGKKDLEALLTTESLRGLPPVFTELGLIRDQGGKQAFDTDVGPLAEVAARIENRFSYGEVASGRYLSDELGKEPFGWSFDTVRLLVVSLLRAGKIEARSKGQVIESAQSLAARNTFPNNNLFRQASFQPKVGLEFEHMVDASQAFRDVFGSEIPELEQSVVAKAIRDAVEKPEEDLHAVHTLLVRYDLPGAEVPRAALDQVRTIRSAQEDQAILTFNGAHRELKEAIRRGAELSQALTEPRLHDLERARRALRDIRPFLDEEPDLGAELRERGETLADLMARESFFRELPAIEEHTGALEAEHARRREEASATRAGAYGEALAKLRATPGWEQLNEDQRRRVSAAIAARADTDQASIPMLREQIESCGSLLRKAVEDLMRMVDGNRVVRVGAASYFEGGIETEEQLDAALEGLREECVELIGAGKKVLVQ